MPNTYCINVAIYVHFYYKYEEMAGMLDLEDSIVILICPAEEPNTNLGV